MNKTTIKNLIGAFVLVAGLISLSSIANAQAYLPSGYSGNYTPVYNGPVVSQPTAYANNYDQVAYTNNNQIYTGFGGGTVVSNTYDNNNDYNNYNASNNTQIYALGNPYGGPKVSSAGNSVSNGNSQNSIGLSVDTYSASGTGFSGSTLNGGFVVTNPVSNTTVWFEYGESMSTLNQKTLGQTFYTTSGSFSKLVYGLKSNTTYYFRAVAQNGQNVAKGDILTLKTSKVISSTGNGSSNTSSGNNGEVLGDSEEIQEEEMNRSNLGALAFWSGFFPDSALGWIILIIIILIIILLARRYREKKAHGAHH